MLLAADQLLPLQPVVRALGLGIADRIERAVQERGEKEVPSSVIGETLMRELHDTDPVAYVRFASVYRSFKDINEFMVELEELLKERKGLPSSRSAQPRQKRE